MILHNSSFHALFHFVKHRGCPSISSLTTDVHILELIEVSMKLKLSAKLIQSHVPVHAVTPTYMHKVAPHIAQWSP